MDDYKLFTIDEEKFPLDKMKAFTSSLHENDQRYVVIIDPGVKVEEGYKPYEEAKENDLFIMNSKESNPVLGKVWPGPVHFLDFLNPSTYNYWLSNLIDFHNTVSFDALWLGSSFTPIFYSTYYLLLLSKWSISVYIFVIIKNIHIS